MGNKFIEKIIADATSGGMMPDEVEAISSLAQFYDAGFKEGIELGYLAAYSEFSVFCGEKLSKEITADSITSSFEETMDTMMERIKELQEKTP